MSDNKEYVKFNGRSTDATDMFYSVLKSKREDIYKKLAFSSDSIAITRSINITFDKLLKQAFEDGYNTACEKSMEQDYNVSELIKQAKQEAYTQGQIDAEKEYSLKLDKAVDEKVTCGQCEYDYNDFGSSHCTHCGASL